jgi:hypothetical protein
MSARATVLAVLIPVALALATASLAAFGEIDAATMTGVACATVVVLGSVWRFGPVHPLTLTLAVSAAYVLAGPIELAAYGAYSLVSAEPMAEVLGQGALFLAAARLAAEWPGRPLPAGRFLFEPGETGWTVPVALACTASVLVVVLIVSTYGLQVGDIGRAEIYANESAALSAARIVTAVFVVLAYAGLRARLVQSRTIDPVALGGFALSVGLFVAAELLILGDRRLVLSMLLGAASVHGVRRLPFALLALAAGGAALLFSYGFVRNRPVEDWAEAWASNEVVEMLRPSNFEFGGFLVVAENMLPIELLPRDYPGYASAFLQVVPKALLPGRPEAPSEWFIRTYYPDLAALGYGYGFNALVESIANLGAIGPAVLGALTGAALACVGRSRVGAGIAAFLAIFLMRLDLASLLRTALLCAVALVLVRGLQMTARVMVPVRSSDTSAV